MSRNELRGLYAITEASLQPPEQLPERVAQALDGGARVLQYRDKSGDAAMRLRQARSLAGLCRASGVALIINDDVQLAVDCGADGVHLGKDDADPAEARRRLGAQAIIGVSCYDQWQRAQSAAEQGADYIAFGRFFASRTKPAAVQADVQLITRARRELGLPVVAIGGITPHNGGQLVAAGADMLAVVQGVFAAADVRRAAAAYAALFTGTGNG
ncbi:MAG: thiamine phosphate synthase [Thiogranum sp.]|nr:thiamine phosphate synthase [Thiogranum sp.]